MPSNEQKNVNGGSTAIDKQEKASLAMTSRGLTPATLDEAWRYATALSKTAFVPEVYRGKPEDCLIAIDTAMRLNVAPLMLLQNSYIVHGRPGMEAKLVIALVNNSGNFTDPLDYEIDGEDPAEKSYRVRAFATRTSTGKILYGPWITWDIVKAEGWESKSGSKWKTIPALMFAYRAATWFARMHCPEVLMGMQTVDELEDVGERRQVESHDVTTMNGIAGAKAKLQAQTQGNDEPTEPEPSTPADSEPPTEAKEEATEGGTDAAPVEAFEDGDLPNAVEKPWACERCGTLYAVKPARGVCVAEDADGFSCKGKIVKRSK
jgi:rubrerythrin